SGKPEPIKEVVERAISKDGGKVLPA
ncbi:MAG: hypothetical protein K0Q94_1994, partial [Paenibacillus sp.]|nr:hypothetical protein [Paenibacillus sp.]